MTYLVATRLLDVNDACRLFLLKVTDEPGS